MDPELENQLMSEGHFVPVHALDDDMKHIQSHMAASRDHPMEGFREHIQYHLLQGAKKQQAAMQQQMQQGMQQQMQGGRPGQQPPRGGAPPRIGAMPQGPQLVKGPPGGIHPDQMARAGAATMPRKY
jgi:hypothetical protein